MPIHEASRSALEFFSDKFVCVDPDDLIISGDFSSDEGSLVKVALIRCQDEDYCRSEKEIQDELRG